MSQQRRPRSSPRAWKRVTLGGAALAVAALLLVTVVIILARPEGAAERDRMAVVGDSNTEMDSPDFAAGQIGDDSWVSTLLAEGFRFAGGWAVAGSTSVQQAEGLDEVENAEVLLVMTGTNDLAQRLDFEETASGLETIVAKAPAERVVLLAIPPREPETTTSSTEFNDMLQDLAEEQGWEFFDGLEFLRSPDGGFVPGTTNDGVHLTPDAQERFGETVIDYLADDDVAPSNG
ncbi:SGNH/GDSL hydrolase family protein [Nesterenkonia sp. CF4.4]|uniref:SGNH/GDSL hydrolase family protein n=1 Tax=Nesterenkonia sp. CF4.4 TaxID=3373079 RepID=UPI003EE81ED3